jgi:hypothetical protein
MRPAAPRYQLAWHFRSVPEAVASGGSRDVPLVCFSRALIDRLLGYKQRMGWQFPYVSTYNTDFPFGFGLAMTEQQVQQIRLTASLRHITRSCLSGLRSRTATQFASGARTNTRTERRPGPCPAADAPVAHRSAGPASRLVTVLRAAIAVSVIAFHSASYIPAAHRRVTSFHRTG